MKTRKIHMTEAQLSNIVKKLNEGTQAVNLGMDNFDNTSLNGATNMIQGFANSNPQTQVNFNGVEVKPGSNTNQVTNDIKKNAQEIINGGINECGTAITKRAIKEAKLKKLKENCVKLNKSDIEKGL